MGVGGVVISDGRALLILRGSPPLEGQWSIPGGILELGETIATGVARELKEETNLDVKVIELIEVFERIFPGDAAAPGAAASAPNARPKYHFVILDYLCEADQTPRAGSDVRDVAWAREDELGRFGLSEAAARVVRKAFAMARARAAK